MARQFWLFLSHVFNQYIRRYSFFNVCLCACACVYLCTEFIRIYRSCLCGDDNDDDNNYMLCVLYGVHSIWREGGGSEHVDMCFPCVRHRQCTTDVYTRKIPAWFVVFILCMHCALSPQPQYHPLSHLPLHRHIHDGKLNQISAELILYIHDVYDAYTQYIFRELIFNIYHCTYRTNMIFSFYSSKEKKNISIC